MSFTSNDYIENTITITTNPSAQTILDGEPAHFNSSSSINNDSLTTSCQWYVDNGIEVTMISGATSNTLTISPETNAAYYENGNMFFCRATSNGSFYQDSSSALLTLNPSYHITIPEVQTGYTLIPTNNSSSIVSPNGYYSFLFTLNRDYDQSDYKILINGVEVEVENNVPFQINDITNDIIITVQNITINDSNLVRTGDNTINIAMFVIIITVIANIIVSIKKLVHSKKN